MEHRWILLVDDNPRDVELTLTALSEEARLPEVTVAGSGVEALDLLQSTVQPPDLILLDLNMPHMDGLAVLDAIRAEDETRDLPVVILTTSGESRDIRESYEHGASAYVVKPMDFGQFQEAIHTITDFWTQLNRRPTLH